jgi:hypothetical protein
MVRRSTRLTGSPQGLAETIFEDRLRAVAAREKQTAPARE